MLPHRAIRERPVGRKREAVKPRSKLEAKVDRWVADGLIDAATGGRIVAFEEGQERGASLRWPVLIAMVFGAILLIAAVSLFVAAHWNEMSPASRFALLIGMAGVFHVSGAALTERFPVLATTFHAVGTATLGAAIFLTAQIFNFQENWATGILLWAIGAGAGYILLRDWPQAALLAILAPAWLVSQWEITTNSQSVGDGPKSLGLICLAICYLSARSGEEASAVRRTLGWIGSIGLVPCVVWGIVASIEGGWHIAGVEPVRLAISIQVAGWVVACGVPLLLAWFLRGRAAWINVLWAAWAYLLILAAGHSQYVRPSQGGRSLPWTLILYATCAVGSAGLVAWGLYEKRRERLNLGIIGFALSVLFFYFDSIMGKLGRSASLLILGVICLAGGYGLEVTRRRLTARMETRS
jgi:hypothetical protein